MSFELNSESLVKTPASGLLGDEFFDAEDSGEFKFVHCTSKHFRYPA